MFMEDWELSGANTDQLATYTSGKDFVRNSQICPLGFRKVCCLGIEERNDGQQGNRPTRSCDQLFTLSFHSSKPLFN